MKNRVCLPLLSAVLCALFSPRLRAAWRYGSEPGSAVGHFGVTPIDKKRYDDPEVLRIQTAEVVDLPSSNPVWLAKRQEPERNFFMVSGFAAFALPVFVPLNAVTFRACPPSLLKPNRMSG
jgi:hypothetical protein